MVVVAGKKLFSVVVAGSWSLLVSICFDPKKILEQADLLYFAKNPESYLALGEGGKKVLCVFARVRFRSLFRVCPCVFAHVRFST